MTAEVPDGPAARRTLAETEVWFERNGLPFFVPGLRARARRGMSPRQLAPVIVLSLLLGLGVGVALWALVGSASVLLASLLWVGVAVLLWYALSRLGTWPVVVWALRRTLSGLRLLVPIVTRALPLLLVFVTFLFINAEVWQLAATLDGGRLWITVMVFASISVVFFLVRVPEEVHRADRSLTEETVGELVTGTPVEALASSQSNWVVHPLNAYERANLTLVLLVSQLVQVLIVAVAVFSFFMVFGALTMTEEVAAAWTGQASTQHFGFADSISVELIQVSVFLAAFSGLYFSVVAITEESYRGDFFEQILGELRRAVAVRAVYLELAAGVGGTATRGQPAGEGSTGSPQSG